MSAGEARGDRALGVVALAVAGLALLALALLLAPGGATGTVRTIVGCLAILVIPGWLVGRLADEDGDAITRAVGGLVATLSVCALSGFVAYEAGLRVAAAVIAVPLLVLVAVAAVLGVTGGRVPRAPLAPLAVACGIGAAALAGAWGTHLALPATPVQAAFSIEAGTVDASPGGFVVTVTVARVRTSKPSQLVLAVGGRRVAVAIVAQGSTAVRLDAPLPKGTTSCPRGARVSVTAPNGAFLTPLVHCVGW